MPGVVVLGLADAGLEAPAVDHEDLRVAVRRVVVGVAGREVAEAARQIGGSFMEHSLACMDLLCTPESKRRPDNVNRSDVYDASTVYINTHYS